MDIYNSRLDSAQSNQQGQLIPTPIMLDLDNVDLTFFKIRSLIEKDIPTSIIDDKLTVAIYLVENSAPALSKLTALLRYFEDLQSTSGSSINSVNILFRGLPNDNIFSILNTYRGGTIVDLNTKQAIVSNKTLLTDSKTNNTPPFKLI